jgi:hypothetical protein
MKASSLFPWPDGRNGGRPVQKKQRGEIAGGKTTRIMCLRGRLRGGAKSGKAFGYRLWRSPSPDSAVLLDFDFPFGLAAAVLCMEIA